MRVDATGWAVGERRRSITPMDEQTKTSDTDDRPCTVCGHPLAEHTFDRSSDHDHFMTCPTQDRLPDPAESSIPVNEFGMPLWEEDPDRQAPPA
ncbi:MULTISPECIES: hypothetical protein [unclassified Plantibacter]|uniref:hypothetical protein n=2 Tax=Plantibacter TaxID=190323 RepID=UPI000ABAFBC3|nr:MULTISPECIES: hypothetical protein [unclassified Plantibacter]